MRSLPCDAPRQPHSWYVRRPAVAPLLAVFVSACAPLSQSVHSIEGANPEAIESVARLAVDAVHPVLLRAVDEKYLPNVQVSSALRSFTYVFHPGVHVLWLSSTPYGLPLIAQRIKCFTLDSRLAAGHTYTLRFDVAAQVPVLSPAAGDEPEVLGALVDEPLIMERGCKWR